jgi:hypothetical protein
MRKYLLTLTLLVSVPGWPMDVDGNYRVIGVPSCGRFIEDTNTAGWANISNMTWVAGYITAYNRWLPDTYDIKGGSNVKSILLWLGNYCSVNPLNDLDQGMTALVNELRPKRARTPKDADK